MAAGLGFKTFTTGEVLTAANVNGYLMQGIWVFASTAARDAAVTSPQEGNFAFTKDTNSLWYYDGAAWVASGATGDIEGVTAGIGISGGGTSGTVTVTNSMATAIDAKGDLVAGTGADTFAKLTVGANDTILTADSTTATGLKWAAAAGGGGMTLLETLTLSGSSVTSSSISGTYKNLQVVLRNVLFSVDNTDIAMRYNSDSNTRYVARATNTSMQSFNATSLPVGNNGDNSTSTSFGVVDIYDYANTTTWKYARVQYAMADGESSTSLVNMYNWSTVYNQTGAITTLTFFPSSGNFSSGSILIYGVK